MWRQVLYIIFIAIVAQATTNLVDRILKENKELNKNTVDPSRLHLRQIFDPSPKLETKTQIQTNCTVANSSGLYPTYLKKWQLGRIVRKHYELVNMLWRKKKEFIEGEGTPSYRPVFLLPKSSPRINPALSSISSTTTPSFIEFYYLDENDDRVITSNQEKAKKIQSPDVFRVDNANYRIFEFQINEPYFLQSAYPANIVSTGNIKSITTTPSLTATSKFQSTTLQKMYPRIPMKRTALSTMYDATVSRSKVLNNVPTDVININLLRPTTIYDRIKFFEIYDKNTPLSDYYQGSNFSFLDDNEKVNSHKKLINDRNIILEHDQMFREERHKSNHVKKHITESNSSKEKVKDSNVGTKSFNDISLKPDKVLNSTKILSLPLNESLESEDIIMPLNALNKFADWTDNSFMAAYIYEPSKVYCDAAGIRPHWLVTSGSCLSRHHKNPGGEGHTAFVAYCGSTWWNTERLAYVKYSVVHPNYHQRDIVRRYMYNIGLVQVVNSMASCPGWAPISMMSHQFTTNPAGSKAHSVGWGLDRYDTRYAAGKLPKHPLLIYESKVFSDSCPGSLGYSKVENHHGEEAVRNVYCLSLPSYAGEQTDPIHGSMLIVDGKLCAIFLQEERRSSGDQSAEYTGTWRLGPWVSRMARELDYVEHFPFVI